VITSIRLHTVSIVPFITSITTYLSSEYIQTSDFITNLLSFLHLYYYNSCTEQNLPVPVEPVIFNKFPSAICASGDPIVHPAETAQLDYEVELTIVIGKTGRRITAENAMSHVAGFTVAHDVSARDWQLKKNGNQWLLGKAVDGFAPLGPSIVTPDEVGDVHNLSLKCIVNGVELQSGNTSTLVHKTEALIAWISTFITLRAGDVILTGTPPGVGCFRKPPIWLHPGDVVTCEIEKLGSITNTIVADTFVPTKSYF
jgi:2-keto-4-pentenoate hydratase/2-oxohepta-3-ene-1,7-dioic acid hydratase in catechol pathway